MLLFFSRNLGASTSKLLHLEKGSLFFLGTCAITTWNCVRKCFVESPNFCGAASCLQASFTKDEMKFCPCFAFELWLCNPVQGCVLDSGLAHQCGETRCLACDAEGRHCRSVSQQQHFWMSIGSGIWFFGGGWPLNSPSFVKGMSWRILRSRFLTLFSH